MKQRNPSKREHPPRRRAALHIVDPLRDVPLRRVHGVRRPGVRAPGAGEVGGRGGVRDALRAEEEEGEAEDVGGRGEVEVGTGEFLGGEGGEADAARGGELVGA